MLWGKKPAHLHLLPTSRTNTFSQVCSPFNKRRRQRCTFLPPLSGDRSRDAFLLYLRRHFRLASPEAIIRTSCVTGKKRPKCGCSWTIYRQNCSHREKSWCVTTAQVWPLKTSCDSRKINAGCRQSGRWSRPPSPAVMKNLSERGRELHLLIQEIKLDHDRFFFFLLF